MPLSLMEYANQNPITKAIFMIYVVYGFIWLRSDLSRHHFMIASAIVVNYLLNINVYAITICALKNLRLKLNCIFLACYSGP